jgi:Zn-dependent protease/CBS domain-containing protein
MRGSLTVLRVKGVPIRVHWTLLLVIPYIAVVFSSDFSSIADMAHVRPTRVVLPPLFWGGILAVGLFVSVAVHELAHTLVALRVGGRVREITLMLIGGASQIERMPRRKGVEALMAAAGPAASLALGAVMLGVQSILPPRAVDLRLGLYYLGQINIALGVFNLLPAFPMDGGRVLRSLLAARLGALRGTRIAALVGRIFAVLIAGYGLWNGNFLLLVIAFFVYAGAGQEALLEKTRDATDGLVVADLMTPCPPAPTLDTPLAAVPSLMRAAGRMELVVVDQRGHPVGVVRAADLARVPRRDRDRLALANLREQLTRSAVQVAVDESASEALERADEAGAEYVIAIDRCAALAGLLVRGDMEKALLLHALDAREPAEHDLDDGPSDARRAA